MLGRIKALTLVLLALASLTALAQTGGAAMPRADFKGARLGMTMEEFRAVNEGYFEKRYVCEPAPAKLRMVADTICNPSLAYPETIAGTKAKRVSIQFYGNELVGIDVAFRSQDVLQIANALEERLGPPLTVKKDPVRNALGATFENDQRLWKVGTDTVIVEKYASDLTTGEVVYMSRSGVEEFNAREKQQASKNKKDL